MMQPIRSIRLYHFPATRSARTKWMLHECVDDAFEVVPVDLYAGEQYAPGYLAMNPNHNVPLLEIDFENGDSLRMIESAAMVSWLADAFPEKGLAPPPGPSKARADYLQMLHFGASPMDMMLWQIRTQEHLLPEEDRDARTTARYRAKFAAEVEPQIAARLEKHGYVCGGAFTAADVIIGHNVGWASGYGLCTDDIFRRYRKRLAERPAFRAAFADIGSFSLAPPAGPRKGRGFNG